MSYKKATIPAAARRLVALRHGAVPGAITPAACTYCSAPGAISWPALHNGRPGGWVSFMGLELDHVLPEYLGGPTEAGNLTLACQPCNRRKGHKA